VQGLCWLAEVRPLTLASWAGVAAVSLLLLGMLSTLLLVRAYLRGDEAARRRAYRSAWRRWMLMVAGGVLFFLGAFALLKFGERLQSRFCRTEASASPGEACFRR